MEKSDILKSLNNAKKQLENFENQKKDLKEKYDTICEFSIKCSSKTNSFKDSMARRKQRLSKLDGLIQKVKTAEKYKNNMQNMLTGSDYMKVANAITELHIVIGTEKRKLMENMQYVDERIAYYKNQVENLKYQYNTYKEDVKNV